MDVLNLLVALHSEYSVLASVVRPCRFLEFFKGVVH